MKKIILFPKLATTASCVCTSLVYRSPCFGKLVTAMMLSAYYNQSCDLSSLFDDLVIAHGPTILMIYHKRGLKRRHSAG